ncbi:MAG: alpha/beta fold hydrolase [Rhodospirillales bacterium]|nr:alpha/beta fold hydrolase [Rhodospirillales bacterium]
MTIWQTERLGPAPHIAIDYAGSGPLVVLLHGVGGNRGNWHDQLPALAPHFTAVAWDARGWGESDDYDGPMRFADISDDLLRVMKRFRAKRVHLVGLSMGGRICLDFYRRHTEHVATMVLAGVSVGLHDMVAPEKRKEALDARRGAFLAGKPLSEMARDLAPSLVSPTASPEIVGRAAESLAALHRDSYIKAQETITAHTDFIPYNEIVVPVLVIGGEDDSVAPPALARHIAAEVPNARLALLPECGHLSNIEKPAIFNRLILDFLREKRR